MLFPSIVFSRGILQASFVQEQPRENMSKTTWERTSVQNLLRNGASGRYYARWTIAGKQKWVNLKSDVFSVAKLKILDEAAKVEAFRQSGAAATAGKGTLGDLINVYEQGVKEKEVAQDLCSPKRRRRLRLFTARRGAHRPRSPTKAAYSPCPPHLLADHKSRPLSFTATEPPPAIRASARLLRRATAVAIAVEACAIRAGAAKFLKLLSQLRAGAVERDTGVVGGHAARDRGG